MVQPSFLKGVGKVRGWRYPKHRRATFRKWTRRPGGEPKVFLPPCTRVKGSRTEWADFRRLFTLFWGSPFRNQRRARGNGGSTSAPRICGWPSVAQIPCPPLPPAPLNPPSLDVNVDVNSPSPPYTLIPCPPTPCPLIPHGHLIRHE